MRPPRHDPWETFTTSCPLLAGMLGYGLLAIHHNVYWHGSSNADGASRSYETWAIPLFLLSVVIFCASVFFTFWQLRSRSWPGAFITTAIGALVLAYAGLIAAMGGS